MRIRCPRYRKSGSPGGFHPTQENPVHPVDPVQNLFSDNAKRAKTPKIAISRRRCGKPKFCPQISQITQIFLTVGRGGERAGLNATGYRTIFVAVPGACPPAEEARQEPGFPATGGQALPPTTRGRLGFRGGGEKGRGVQRSLPRGSGQVTALRWTSGASVWRTLTRRPFWG